MRNLHASVEDVVRPHRGLFGERRFCRDADRFIRALQSIELEDAQHVVEDGAQVQQYVDKVVEAIEVHLSRDGRGRRARSLAARIYGLRAIEERVIRRLRSYQRRDG